LSAFAAVAAGRKRLSSTAETYQRQRQREGKVPLATKIFQAIGAVPESLKNFAFGTFVLLFYNQILGANAFYVSLCLAVALTIDAAFDPLIGSFSDGLKTRLGRRHLLMYLSAAPIGLGLYLVFSPPHGLSQPLLLAWLFGSVILTNISMSLFVVPWTALFAEFSEDYTERTTIVTWRYIVGWVIPTAFTLATYRLIFPNTHDHPVGQLNPAGYAHFGPAVALSTVAAILLTTELTRREIPYLLQPTKPTPRFSLLTVWRDVSSTFGNRDFVILFSGALLFAAVTGTTGTLGIYMSTYFWGLTSAQLQWFTIGIVGAVAAFVSLGFVGRMFDKKTVLLASFAILVIDGMGVTSLRLLHLMPPNGSNVLLAILVANDTVAAGIGVFLGIMFVSMLADTIDVQELATGRRQEGVFAAALSFSGKATAGLGTVLAGFLLQEVVHWPAHVDPSRVDPHMLTRLGLVQGVLVPLLLIIPFALGTRLRVTRARHARIREELDRRRAGAATAVDEGALAEGMEATLEAAAEATSG
jgi:glycoside/pentoside/hexuronide:cation symporter, GPH family